MTIHLLTVSDETLIKCVREACERRFKFYSFRVRRVDDELQLEATYVGQKQLTNSQANIAAVLLPEYARAYRLGWLDHRDGSISQT